MNRVNSQNMVEKAKNAFEDQRSTLCANRGRSASPRLTVTQDEELS